MLTFNNTHVFTGYLKQLLSTVNIPTCKIYSTDFANYLERHGSEDPRIVESADIFHKNRIANRINYLKNNKLYYYYWNYPSNNFYWKSSSDKFYDIDKKIPGLTKTLYSPGCTYDKKTHEYLGDYLRFLRDYYDVNLMSMYNCFNNTSYSNIYCKIPLYNSEDKNTTYEINFDSYDQKYIIYAFPVKLFSSYTVALDCSQGIEMFCGLYKNNLDLSDKAVDLIKKTYQRVNSAIFKQPFLYDKLSVDFWNREKDLSEASNTTDNLLAILDEKTISRWDIVAREQDLKLFIKVPIGCKSSITILEGDYRNFNDFKYIPNLTKSTDKLESWEYISNRAILNFNTNRATDNVNLNESSFKPISKLQLLAFNTGESYPFSDRLIEYLSDSTITSIETIADNIKRVQNVMKQNNYYFKIDGIWENQMQKIAYDYMLNSGPIEAKYDEHTRKKYLVDKHQGYHPIAGYTKKSLVYDTLGYIDRDVEKYYAKWTAEELKDSTASKVKVKAKIKDSILNTDIYNGLYDL